MGDTLIESIEHRVIRLEVKVDDHEEELHELHVTSKALSSALHGIEKTLLHIKWLAMGGVIVMFGKELGIEKVITLILGVL